MFILWDKTVSEVKTLLPGFPLCPVGSLLKVKESDHTSEGRACFLSPKVSQLPSNAVALTASDCLVHPTGRFLELLINLYNLGKEKMVMW